jgi:outer membrane immunogenic protein
MGGIFVRSSAVKRNVLGLVSVLALAIAVPMGAAHAADMGMKAPYSPPMAPAYFNWTGFYVGGNFGGGYATTNASGSSTFDETGAAPVASTFAGSYGAGGVLGGGQIGANYQFTNHWVIGFEADIDGSSLNGSSTNCSTGAAGTVGCAGVSTKFNDFGTVRGRLGYAGDNLLLYGTGGWAWGQSSTTSNLNCVSAAGLCPGTSSTFTGGSSSASTTATNGWAAGAGFEWAFTRNWIFRLEYLHLQFNGNGEAFASSGTVGGVPFTSLTNSTANVNMDIGRVGLNYLFH